MQTICYLLYDGCVCLVLHLYRIDVTHCDEWSSHVSISIFMHAEAIITVIMVYNIHITFMHPDSTTCLNTKTDRFDWLCAQRVQSSHTTNLGIVFCCCCDSVLVSCGQLLEVCACSHLIQSISRFISTLKQSALQISCCSIRPAHPLRQSLHLLIFNFSLSISFFCSHLPFLFCLFILLFPLLSLSAVFHHLALYPR